MRIAQVILDIPTRALDAPYTYAVASSLEDVEIGCAVLVPFGNRRAIGYIIELSDLQSGEETLKEIEQVLSPPYFDEKGAACALYMSKRYVAPLSSCIRLFIPQGASPRVVKGHDGIWRVEHPKVGSVDDRWITSGDALDSYTPRGNALKQRAIIECVKRGDIKVSELSRELGNVSQAIKALEKHDVIRIVHRRRMRRQSDAPSMASYERPHSLTEDQHHAVAVIEEARKQENGSVVVIDGVTGSGKTEVYLRAIEAALAEGKGAIMLIPEIALTPQTVARFRGRFGDMVAVMHSKMSAGERFDEWDTIRTGNARVVVGARSALFVPLDKVGLIIIDEEHETTYKQESAPRYVTRNVAEWMAQKRGACVVLGSATPSLEALYGAHHNKTWTLVDMPTRATGAPLPAIEVVDMAAEFSAGSRAMFSARLTSAITKELSEGRKVVLLLNQRGFASFLLCRDCGFVPECVNCSTSLTYHERGNKLVCHHCGYTVSAPAVCPACSSPYLKRFGAGTQRVEDELRSLLDAELGAEAAIPIVRMDADTTSAKGAHQRLLESFAAAPRAVLLGTQMIAKGLDFDEVTLVGVINADTQLHLPDFRASERTFDLIEQVAGRAGRKRLPGRVIVQTYMADSYAIVAAAAYDRQAFLAHELPKRRMLKWPPYVRMANVLVWGKCEQSVRTQAQELHAIISLKVRALDDCEWEVLPASTCVLSRVRGNYRWHIVVKAPLSSDISQVLRQVAEERKAQPDVQMAIDIDPIDLL